MSQENVELTRAFFEAWNARDMDAVRESYDPHVVVRYAEDWPEGSEPIMGREAVMRGWERNVRSSTPTPLNCSKSSTWVTEPS